MNFIEIVLKICLLPHRKALLIKRRNQTVIGPCTSRKRARWPLNLIQTCCGLNYDQWEWCREMSWLEPRLCAPLVCVDLFEQWKNKYSAIALFVTKYSGRQDCAWLPQSCDMRVNSCEPSVRYNTHYCPVVLMLMLLMQSSRLGYLGFSLLNAKISGFCT
jgi:hypothetical protein